MSASVRRCHIFGTAHDVISDNDKMILNGGGFSRGSASQFFTKNGDKQYAFNSV